jgi:hypothetical protein
MSPEDATHGIEIRYFDGMELLSAPVDPRIAPLPQ